MYRLSCELHISKKQGYNDTSHTSSGIAKRSFPHRSINSNTRFFQFAFFLGLILCFFSSEALAQTPASRPAAKKPAAKTKKTAKAAVKKVPAKKIGTTTKKAVSAKKAAPAKRATKPAKRATKPVKKPAKRIPFKKALTSPKKKKSKNFSKNMDKLDKALKQITNILAAVIYRFGRDDKNPWLLSHSLLAIGKGLRMYDGSYAVDKLVSGFLKFKKVGKTVIPYFPQGDAKNRIEPHPYMHLKTLLELGVPLSYKFKAGKKTVTLKQLFKSNLDSFPDSPKKERLGVLAWRIFALYGQLPNNKWGWVNAKGKYVNLFKIIYQLFYFLDRQTTFLRTLKTRGVKTIQKRRQFIYKEPCGGFHLIQAALRWTGHPLFRNRKRLIALRKAQIELLFYRLDGEMRLYSQMFKMYSKKPGHRFLILLQQLKFIGHFLETMVNLHKWKLFSPTKAQRLKIRYATKVLYVTVVLIYKLGYYHKLPQLKKASYQYYLDLLGDSAHALHAIRELQETKIYKK